jgi:hypothetical protein
MSHLTYSWRHDESAYRGPTEAESGKIVWIPRNSLKRPESTKENQENPKEIKPFYLVFLVLIFLGYAFCAGRWQGVS